jgi:threonine dehydratase
MVEIPTLAHVREAAERIRPYAHRTPVMTCETLDRMTGNRLYFKCENLQKVGAFKFRGACNAVFSLSEAEAARGVGTHSSGNHAQALSLAAALRGIPAHVVMPNNAPKAKMAAVKGYGGLITLCEPTMNAREETLAGIISRIGVTEIHPYDNFAVVSGQGTAALELLEEVPGLDAVLAPVGGGGLLSGTAITAKALSPHTRVIAGEPELVDDAYRSLEAGHIVPSSYANTIADGLKTSLGELSFAVIRRDVERIVTVSEDEIVAAMRLVWERMKLIVEPSAAVPVAVLFSRKVDLKGQRIGVILSGGNVDLGSLPWMECRS